MTEAEIRALQESCGTLTRILEEALKYQYISPHRTTGQWIKEARLAVGEAEELLGTKHTVPQRMIFGSKDPPTSEHWGREPL